VRNKAHTRIMIYRLFCINIILFLLISHSNGQGCSDAGFCTINTFKPNSKKHTNVLKNQIKTGAFFGRADNSISVFGSYVEFSRQLSKQLELDAKITSLAQNGNGITVYGLSDFFINANYNASEIVKFTFGAKLPLSKANQTYENLPLPMDYQSSLGTLDLIFGIAYEIKKIQFVAAVQQPLTQNDNQFIASNYPVNATLSAFQSTNKFQRSGDILVRVSYPVKIQSKITITPSLLPIYHLANDKYTDESNIIKEIKGSQGMTVNGNLYLDYALNNKHKIQFNLAMPFVVRTARPDGLTRSIIASLEYLISF
jgi:hypothetical protein